MQHTSKKHTFCPRFRTDSHIAAKFTCDSHICLYRYAGCMSKLQHKAVPLSSLVDCVCIMQYVLENVSNDTTCLMPRDREKEEPSAIMCLKINQIIFKED